MNIILIAEKLHYRDWLGKTYRDILIYYSNNSKNKVSLVYTDEYVKYNKEWFIEQHPDIVVFLGTSHIGSNANHFRYVFELNYKVFSSGLDYFAYDMCINCHWIKKCDGMLHFGHAKKLLLSYKEHFPEKIIKSFNGRFINSNIFKKL